MKNADMPAMPSAVDLIELNDPDSGKYPNGIQSCSGLTKREQFAAMAMQGLLANSVFIDSLFQNCDELDSVFDNVSRAAVMSADALLKELEK